MQFNIFLLIFIIIFRFFVISFPKLSKETKNLFFLRVCFLVFTILVGFREFNVGNDTSTYLALFKNCSILGWKSIELIANYEKGYLILNVLISLISNSSRFFMIILSIICNYSIYKFIKDNSKNYFVSIIFYITLLFFYSSMTMMRQFVALSIILLGFKYVKNKSLIKFILIVLLASTFHSSAFIALLLYPMYHLKFTNKKVVLILIISIFVYVFLGSLFNNISLYLNKSTAYIDKLGDVKVASVLYTAVYFVIYIFTYVLLKNNKNEKNNSFYLFIALISFLINFLSIKISILSRASQYFTIFIIVILPNIIDQYKFDKRSKPIMYFIICILFIIYSSTIICLRPEWNSAFNYKNCAVSHTCFD